MSSSKVIRHQNGQHLYMFMWFMITRSFLTWYKEHRIQLKSHLQIYSCRESKNLDREGANWWYHRRMGPKRCHTGFGGKMNSAPWLWVVRANGCCRRLWIVYVAKHRSSDMGLLCQSNTAREGEEYHHHRWPAHNNYMIHLSTQSNNVMSRTHSSTAAPFPVSKQRASAISKSLDKSLVVSHFGTFCEKKLTSQLFFCKIWQLRIILS